MAGNKILIVEDDTNLLETLKYNIAKEGYQPVTAQDGITALSLARREKPDLILLDLMLPELNGLEVCRIVRNEMNVPILILTAKSDETDKIVGLEIGADDYMTKPFSVRELMARVRALLRRSQPENINNGDTASTEPIRVKNLRLDTARHKVTMNGKNVDLNPKEFDLLAFLMQNQGLVFSREKLLEKVWGYDYYGDNRTVDVHIRWLRQKIEFNPAEPEYLITIRGIGYKMEG